VNIEPLAIAGTWLCTPAQFPDDRGVFLEWFRGDRLAEATNGDFVPVQANHSVSARGVVRGVHYADVPPGQAKYVYCARGRIYDVVVDLRVGSPTFGRHVGVWLDDVDRRALFIAEGLGHAFYAGADSAEVVYLVSTPYNPQREHAVAALDPQLAIEWPGDARLSPRDAAAPTLAAAEAAGLLPRWTDCALGR
jgi:dTDP-4-dehydrorhamnose 3,5-epimerase